MIDPKKYATPTEAEHKTGVNRTTLLTALNRGEIRYTKTAGGTMLISLKSVEAWKLIERKRGRKAKGKNT